MEGIHEREGEGINGGKTWGEEKKRGYIRFADPPSFLTRARDTALLTSTLIVGDDEQPARMSTRLDYTSLDVPSKCVAFNLACGLS